MTGPNRRDGISSLTVEGYKSIRNRQTIDIRQLTILAGVNSSGKSSIMQPLLLLKQTSDASYDPGPLQLDGPNVSITAIDQVLSRGQTSRSRVRTFAVAFKIGNRETSIRFGKSPVGDLQVLEYTGWFSANQKAPVTLNENMTSPEVEDVIPDDLLNLYRQVQKSAPSSFRVEFVVQRDRFYLTPALGFPRTVEGSNILNLGVTEASLRNELSRVIHLPALRGNPKRTYPTTGAMNQFPGTFDVYAAGLIASWRTHKQTATLGQLQRDLEELGLTWKAEARQLVDTQVELRVGRLPHARPGGARDLVNIADVGFGVSQTLPVIVALLAAKRGQLVYLEQPEIHLHPRSQVKFGYLVKRAIDRGVRIVAETHSSLFIRSIQTLVAAGDISPSDVALHWFTRDPDSGVTQITTAALDEYGTFGDWPEDFDDVQVESESNYLDAVARRDIPK